MRYRSSLTTYIHTCIGSLLIAIVVALAGFGLAIVGSVLEWLPLLSVFAWCFTTAAAVFAVVASMLPGIAVWQIIAAPRGWWRIECALDTGKEQWAWRGWHASGTQGWEQWGVGVDVLGCRLDVYTVQGDKS